VATDADTYLAITQALQDSLMVVATPGWREVDLELVMTPSGVRIISLAARGDGANEPPPRAPINIDKDDEADRLGDGLTELNTLLESDGKKWEITRAQIRRGPDSSEWKLVQTDGTLVWSQKLGPDQLDQLVFTDALFDVLRGTGKAVASLQKDFDAKHSGATRHEFNEFDGTLTLYGPGTKFTAPAQLIGTYAGDNFLWVWGWAIDEIDKEVTDRVRAVCAPDAAQPGLSALWRDHFHCDEGFAWALASHVAVAMGARGVYRGEEAGTPVNVLYAVMDAPA
jgi:hypothetical protein